MKVWNSSEYFLCGIGFLIMTGVLFLSGNELLSFVMPIFFSEIIPRIYVMNSNRHVDFVDNGKEAKTSKELALEDSMIMFFYVLYISFLVAFYGSKLCSQYNFLGIFRNKDIFLNYFYLIDFFGMIFLLVYGFLMVSLKRLSEKVYK